MLYGHNDGRKGLKFCGYSGWLVFNIPDLKNGKIVVKFESWHFPPEALPYEEGWETINNERMLGSLIDEEDFYWNSTSLGRKLKQQPKPWCDEFKFEYAIDGKITTLGKDQWLEKKKDVQRVVETQVLLDDPKYTGGKEKEVEVAIRITGCGHDKVFNLNHVYWS